MARWIRRLLQVIAGLVLVALVAVSLYMAAFWWECRDVYVEIPPMTDVERIVARAVRFHPDPRRKEVEIEPSDPVKIQEVMDFVNHRRDSWYQIRCMTTPTPQVAAVMTFSNGGTALLWIGSGWLAIGSQDRVLHRTVSRDEIAELLGKLGLTDEAVAH